MKVLSGNELVNTLNNLSNKVKKRLWIGVPFIGDWKTVRSILGRIWIDNATIDVKLITDIDNQNNLDITTIKHFHDRGKIKSIKGLHAKIYIIDNNVIITSANLTNTAFTKRYEIGVILSEPESIVAIELYNRWWNNLALDVPPDWKPNLVKKQNIDFEEGLPHITLKNIWKLPIDPGDPFKNLKSEYKNYDLFLRAYEDLAQKYSKIQRIWPNTNLYFEIDSFLNYLFHHEKKPSNKYKKFKPRVLNENEKLNELNKYTVQFKDWITKGSEGVEDKPWREESSKIIQNILNKKNISKINKNDIETVVSKLNCMQSLPLNKFRFLNPTNNNINIIKLEWENLLHNQNIPLQIRMNKCNKNLKFFGKAGIGELLGFYNPDKYPLKNRNSISGLKFFGYNISLS